jgi:hypothetical protein
MANIDTIEAFAAGKQRFGYLRNDYFLIGGHMYYKSTLWPVAVWLGPIELGGEDVVLINVERRGNEDAAKYVLDELARRGIKTKIGNLKDIQKEIDG